MVASSATGELSKRAISHILSGESLHALCARAQYEISVLQRLNLLTHGRATFQILCHRLKKTLWDVKGVEGDLGKVRAHTFHFSHDGRVAKKRNQRPSNTQRHKEADRKETWLGEKAADDLFLVLNRT